MIALTNLFTNTVVVSRLVPISGNKDIMRFSTVTIEPCSIQRLGDEKTVSLGGSIGKLFRLYADSTADIQKGDRLKDENGNYYKVRSVSIPASIGNFVHIEAIIELEK